MEAALALCGLALVTALAVGALAAVTASIRCHDAARELVRLAARGEPERGRAVAARLAPSGARVTLSIQGDEAVGEVTAPPLRVLPVHVGGRAVAVLEPGVLEQAALQPAAQPAPQPAAQPAAQPAPQPAALRTGAVEPAALRPVAARPARPAPPGPAAPEPQEAREPSAPGPRDGTGRRGPTVGAEP